MKIINKDPIMLSKSHHHDKTRKNVFSNKHKTAHGIRDISVITDAAIEVAEKLGASAIITFSEVLPEVHTNIPVLVFKGKKFVMINQFSRYLEETEKNLYEVIEKKAESVVEEICDASVIAFINDLIDAEGLAVGIVRMNDSDTIVVYDLSKNETMKKIKECTERADVRVIRSVLKVALEIAMQGREGRLFGTGFIIGDSDEVMRRSHQLVLNPFEGQLQESRNIVNPECWETVKSFAQLDGVFVISSDGIIHAAGRYLDISAKDVPVEKGLGGRHASAAAITRDTETIAITVSSSGGVIRIYKDGLEIVKIEPDVMLVK